MRGVKSGEGDQWIACSDSAGEAAPATLLARERVLTRARGEPTATPSHPPVSTCVTASNGTPKPRDVWPVRVAALLLHDEVRYMY